MPEAAAAAAIHRYAQEAASRRPQKDLPTGADDPAWRALARDLGGHPLACRIAGSQCGEHPSTPAQFHQRLADRGLRAIATSGDSRENLDILFRHSAEALDAPARRAWAALTFAGSALTPSAFLRALGCADAAPFERLVALGLATSGSAPSPETGQNEPAYALADAILGEWGRTALAEYGIERDDVLGKAKQWALEYWEKFDAHPEDHCRPAQYAIVDPIAGAILHEVEPRTDIPADVLDTFYYLPARMHEHHSQFALAEPIYRRCVARMKADAGESSPEYATALNNLGTLLQDTNRLAEAEPLMRRALEIDEEIYGPSHPDVAIRLNNLALLLKATNRLAEAEPLLRRAVLISMQFTVQTGHQHPNLQGRIQRYARLCREMNFPEKELRPRLFGMCREAGTDDETAQKILASAFQ